MILGKTKRNSILGKYSFIRSSTLLNSCWVLSPTRHLTFVSGRFLWPTPNWPRYDILPSPLICLNQPFASPITGLLGASLCARLGIKYQVFFHHRLCGFRRLGRRHVWRVADHGIPLGLPSCPPSPLVMPPPLLSSVKKASLPDLSLQGGVSEQVLCWRWLQIHSLLLQEPSQRR